MAEINFGLDVRRFIILSHNSPSQWSLSRAQWRFN